MNAAELSPRRRRRRFLVGYGEGDLTVKREPADEDIKDYAETTMNELLGWYGYEKVDSRDTQGLNLTHFASNSNNNPSSSNGNASPPSSAMEGSDVSEDDENSPVNDGPDRLRPVSISPGPDVSSTASDEVARQHQTMVSALSTITKHPNAPDSPNLPPGCIVCAWCQKVGMKLFTLKTPNGCKAFCSELCFTQCRRASFKKNKICDWCKHVRHTVNYVDFQDGEQQLQFCSDKCLNQYKMNIFCKETQAHLQMHTHLKEAACKMAAGESVNLITPDLWLRDCKMNGNAMSPLTDIDVTEDINSDGNMSNAPSPSTLLESPLPSHSPPIIPKEKKEDKKDLPPPPPLPPEKEKDKPSKKTSSKHSPKKPTDNNKSRHSKPHRSKKENGITLSNEVSINSRRSPVQASPPTHHRNSQSTNGSHSLLSPPPPPMSSMSRPPPHLGLPPRPCHPVPSPLGMPGLEQHNRQPFLHHNMMPPPFQFLAQQQMEAFFRSQHGMDPRSKVPPPLHLPPWMVPPFPHPRPPPPPHLPPPTLNHSKSPSLSRSSPPSSKSHHHQTSPPQKSSHHSRHKHNRHPSHPTSINNNPTLHKNTSNSEVPLNIPSALPPVTVMVPFPLLLPIPLPIPIPIPIPPNIMEKFSKLKRQEKSLTNSDPNLNYKSKEHHHRKRKNSYEYLKQKKRKTVASASGASGDIASDTFPNSEIAARNIPTEKYFDSIENLSFRISETVPVNFSHSQTSTQKPSKPDTDAESRSYSPLSEAISSNEEELSEKIIPSSKNCEVDDFSNINFSNFNLSLMRSSPLLLSQAAERQLQLRLNEGLENCNSQSPTNLSVKETHDIMSSNAVDFKKKHLRDQMSLMI